MKTNKTLSNHPTLVNDCFRINVNLNTASRCFRSAQDSMARYNADNGCFPGTIDLDLDAAIENLQEAVQKLRALKNAYKVYATEL